MFLEFTDVLLVDLWAALPFPASGRREGGPEPIAAGYRPKFSLLMPLEQGQTKICPDPT
jgi:hypothetical protein